MANKSQFDVLIGIYREAQTRLAEIITGNYGAGTRTYYNSVLKQLERLMKQLEAETGQYISTEIPRQYKKALDDTYAYFKRNNLQMKRPDMFSHIHSDAVSELANEMRYHINQGISIAGRRVMRYLDTAKDNALRQAGLRSAALKAAAGQTVADMQKDLMQRLANDGFLTVQYGTGKRAYQVGLDSYAAMVARSTTREAGNLARENQLTENGYDLMMMTEHYPTCEACAVLQGRVYSISGRDKRFPPLSRAFPSGYRNVHPNCRHVMTYWIEEMQSPEEIRAALARSNAPFTDNRSDEEIALYSKQQADSRRMRADRSQFERYRQRLGEDAPKSFHTFRRIKNADGQKWKEMQSLYRSKSPKNVDFSAENDIIKAGSDDVTEIIKLGKINTQPLKSEFNNILTDDIIITNERIEHIKLRHPEDYKLFKEYGSETVTNPDLIIKDCKNKGTIFMIKKLPDTNLNVVARLVLDEDNPSHKNSVMTFYRIRNKNLIKLENKNKTLYKKE